MRVSQRATRLVTYEVALRYTARRVYGTRSKMSKVECVRQEDQATNGSYRAVPLNSSLPLHGLLAMCVLSFAHLLAGGADIFAIGVDFASFCPGVPRSSAAAEADVRSHILFRALK